MQFSMKNLDQLNLREMKELLASSRKVAWGNEDVEARYALISSVLKVQGYRKMSKAGKGVVRAFLQKVTDTSRAQLTRLIGRWMRDRKIVRRAAARPEFAVRYQREDIVLLAATDAVHEDLSGPALRRILLREFEVFGRQEYQQLAGISASHLYNLRKSAVYCNQRVRVEQTKSRQIDIGERRKPDPKGKPGFLRVDTVHQGHKDGKPGVFYINSVDTVTQWQNLGCVETISERHMLPVLDHWLPFRQRQRVSEPSRCQANEQAVDRVHQIARLPHDRQRIGGGQERSRRTQTHRLRVYRRRACSRTPTVLYRAVQPLPELSSAVRFCGAGE